MPQTDTITADPVDDGCPCYKCTSEVVEYDDKGRRVTKNNLHGRLQPCEECGHAKSEYVDLGRKGHYECWWCNHRAAGPDGP